MKTTFKKSISILLALLLLLSVGAALAGCKKTDASADEAKSPLLGTWAANEAEGCAYIFSEDGKGVWDAGEGMTMNFTYADKGETLEITYEGSATTQIWTYVIDGTLLTMTDTDTGSVLTYTKK